MQSYIIDIYGIVQGVGFRPFIYNLALLFHFKGYVQNTGSRVKIYIANAKKIQIERFIKHIQQNPPPNTILDDIIITQHKEKENYDNFSIKPSRALLRDFTSSTLPKDLAICKDCIKELENPRNRRYEYAFINCIHCGPRYTIIKSLPYDRANTAMNAFCMCPQCLSEYNNPLDRRFHAQPNSCDTNSYNNCGPTIKLFDNNNNPINTNVIKQTRQLIARGKIIAIKGMGGFNLVCKVESRIIKRLRNAKNRPHKPFAIMFRDIAHIKRYFNLSKLAESILTSPQAPILLLRKPLFPLPQNLAPNLCTIGVLIAYTPLHRLLFKGRKTPLIFTSANLSSEPIIYSKEKMFEKMPHCFDYLLDYNRDIYNPIDDSVLTLAHKIPIFLRTARGFYPLSIKMPYYTSQCILALGANQKCQIAIFYHHHIIISPYISDLESVASMQLFERTIMLFLDMFHLKPNIILCDMHPQYHSRKIAISLSKHFGAKILSIYHHLAHFYSVLLDNKIENKPKILGIIFDGTGLGEDKKIWGGEFFVKENSQIRRILHFKYFPIIGDNNTLRDNFKIAFGILFSVLKEKVLNRFRSQRSKMLYQIFTQQTHCFFSSSVGRIFDFVAYFCGVETQTFEGQSGMIIESLYNKRIKGNYPYIIADKEIILDEMFIAILRDSKLKDSQSKIASKFINTLVKIILEVATKKLNREYLLVFSGGVFQNKILCEQIILECQKHKIPYRFHSKVSPNDSGISLGQIGAYLAKNYHHIK